MKREVLETRFALKVHVVVKIMSKFFEDLKQGLEDLIAHREGKIKLRSTSIEIPEPPVNYKAKEIKKYKIE